MSTVTPVIIDPGTAYIAAQLNTAIQGVTDGYNAIEDDDLAAESFGHDVVHPIVAPGIPVPLLASTVASDTFTGAYPGFGLALGTWNKVFIFGDSLNIMLTALPVFEIGATSPQKIAHVKVGATFEATVPMPTDEAHLAFGLKTSANAFPDVIPATDFKVSHTGDWSMEYTITEADIGSGVTLEEIWLMAIGPDVVTVGFGQIWAIPIHSDI